MGVALGLVRFLLREGIQQPWQGSVLTLGRQDIGVTEEELRSAAKAYSYRLRTGKSVELSEKPKGAARGFVSDKWFFWSLGFDSIVTLDASGYEGADIIFDLNKPQPPEECIGRFDLVLDGGTVEHIFEVGNALRSVCQMAQVGGRIVHLSPMSNCADHGFYCFSPTLFADFYAANGFLVQRIGVARFDRDPVAEDWEYSDYRPEDFGTIGSLERGTYFLLACVRRTQQSRWDLVPQQSYYRNLMWKDRV